MALTLRQKQRIADRARTIIFTDDNDYGGVIMDDQGIISIGKAYWHGSRALSLLKVIIHETKDEALQILGETLYNDIDLAEEWNETITLHFDPIKVAQLLTTEKGRMVQDHFIGVDLLNYVNRGVKYGLKDEDALIYFADGVTQYGESSILWKNIAQASLPRGGTLDAVYDITREMTSNYMVRRSRVYNDLLKARGEELEDKAIRITPEVTTIQMIQKWINDYCGVGIEITGAFDDNTKSGLIRAIQKYHNTAFGMDLVEDGQFGLLTARQCTYVSAKHYEHSDLTFIAQCALYLNGYDPVWLDSSFGQDTMRAVLQFQKDHNIPETGEVGESTFRKLLA